MKVIKCYPTPIFLEFNGIYSPVTDVKYWKPDLNGIYASHILCDLIDSDLDEDSRQKIITVVNYIHANRTLLVRKSVYSEIELNEILRERIKAVYDIDGDIFAPEGLPYLLHGNAYVKPTFRTPYSQFFYLKNTYK